MIAIALSLLLAAMPAATLRSADSGVSMEAQAAILLYGVTRRLDHIGLLMLIKAESDPVDRLTDDIASVADAIQSDLKAYAKAQSFSLDTVILPEAERAARDFGQKQARGRLVRASGAEFCREFLKVQFLALNQMKNLVNVLDGLQPRGEVHPWSGHAATLAELTGRLDTLWVEVCPTRRGGVQAADKPPECDDSPLSE